MVLIELIRIEGNKCLYDLSSGYLGDDPIGTYDGQMPIYSAEALLEHIEYQCLNEGKRISILRVMVDDEKIYREE